MKLTPLIIRNIIAFAVAFIISVIASLYWLYTDMQRGLNSPMSLQTMEYLNITPGMSLSSIAGTLVEEDWIAHPYYLILQARWKDQAQQIKAGEYTLEPGMSQLDLLDKLVAGKVIQYSLTIPEGLSFREIIRLVQQHDHLVKTLDYSGTGTVAAQLDFLERPPEGLFYPDTYHFPRGTTDRDFLFRCYQTMQRILAEEWQYRDTGLPYDAPYEALIMASIIEKETAAATERDRIAGVFVRRLQQGMKLQTDPTVIYAMGEDYDGNIRRRDLYRDSPYNTYVYRGLPPTPIAAPGRDSIRAALQPANGDELYFVARGDGTHVFSSTLQDHNRAVRTYQINSNESRSP